MSDCPVDPGDSPEPRSITGETRSPKRRESCGSLPVFSGARNELTNIASPISIINIVPERDNARGTRPAQGIVSVTCKSALSGERSEASHSQLGSCLIKKAIKTSPYQSLGNPIKLHNRRRLSAIIGGLLRPDSLASGPHCPFANSGSEFQTRLQSAGLSVHRLTV